jgi:hypothetical protein
MHKKDEKYIQNFSWWGLFVKPRCRWDDSIKTDLYEIGYNDMDWIRLVEVRV